MPHFNNYNPASFGWKPSPRGEFIVPYSFNGVKFPNGVHKATVKWWDSLLTEVTQHIQLKAGQCWGYNYRPITGGGNLSSHAYGLALDINAVDNPYSASGKTLPHTMPDIVIEIARRHGAESGLGWTRPKDAMHLQCNVAPDEISKYTLNTKPVPKPAPPKISYGPFGHITLGARTIRLGSAGTDVQFLQRFLDIPDDGLFGPVTQARVKWYQKMRGLVVDGIVGPKTWLNIRHGR